MSPQPLPWVGKRIVCAEVGGRKLNPDGQRKLYIHMHAQPMSASPLVQDYRVNTDLQC